MLPIEREKYLEDKKKLEEIFRVEDIKHYPIIIKASTAGTLRDFALEN
jgi:hypothetical protein